MKEPRRAAFDAQATPKLLEKVHRATRARIYVYGGRVSVNPDDVHDLMMGVITDTLDGTLAWDHERKPLQQHLLDAVKYRARDEARRRLRNKVRTEELEEETTDVSLGEQLVAGAAPKRPDEEYAMREIADALVADVQKLVATDPEVATLLDAIVNRGAFERVDIMKATGFSAATYKNARRRLDRTLVELPPGTRDAVMSALTN
jgi:hypothetical protein